MPQMHTFQWESILPDSSGLHLNFTPQSSCLGCSRQVRDYAVPPQNTQHLHKPLLIYLRECLLTVCLSSRLYAPWRQSLSYITKHGRTYIRTCYKSQRTFCNDANVLYLCCSLWQLQATCVSWACEMWPVWLKNRVFNSMPIKLKSE